MKQKVEVGIEVIEAVSDIVLTVDRNGRIDDVHFGPEYAGEPEREWIGSAVVETLTPATRKKWEDLVREAEEEGISSPRQVNHLLPSGREVPVRYTGVRLGTTGKMLAVGRDLEAVARLQQELLEAQQSMERDYWRMRQIETRYRLLFQASTEAVLVVDAESREIVDCNPAAGELLDAPVEDLVGQTFPWGFDEDAREALNEHLAAAERGRSEEPVRVRRSDGEEDLRVRAHGFRQEDRRLLMVQIQGGESARTSVDDEEGELPALELLRRSPDGFVVIDPDGEILEVNDTFVQLLQAASREQLVGEPLDRWFGRPGADLDVLEPILRTHGSVRRFRTVVRGEVGSVRDVEVSGVAALEADVPCFAFLVRDVERMQEPRRGVEGSGLDEAVEELSGLMGQASLKELVDDTVEMVERELISTALDMTGNNRTAAAELLGISRQSLYTKLERYGLDGNSDS